MEEFVQNSSTRELKAYPVWEAMTCLNERSALGRVVVNPPSTMAPLRPHKTGEIWFVCPDCGFGCLSGDKMRRHYKKHADRDDHKHDDNDSDNDGKDDSCEADNDNDGDDEDEEEEDVVEKAKVPSPVSHDLRRRSLMTDYIRREPEGYKFSACRKISCPAAEALKRKLRKAAQKISKVFNCSICGAEFKKKRSLKRHMVVSHDKSFAHQCKVCPCKFEARRGLLNHMAFYHRKELPDATTKAKPAEENKTNEMDVITNDAGEDVLQFLVKKVRKLQEEVAKKHAIRKVTLQSIKQSKQNFVVQKSKVGKQKTDDMTCPICCIPFMKANLRRHMNKLHNGEGTWECSLCPCAFTSQGSLGNHTTKYHPNGKTYSLVC